MQRCALGSRSNNIDTENTDHSSFIDMIRRIQYIRNGKGSSCNYVDEYGITRVELGLLLREIGIY